MVEFETKFVAFFATPREWLRDRLLESGPRVENRCTSSLCSIVHNVEKTVELFRFFPRATRVQFYYESVSLSASLKS